MPNATKHSFDSSSNEWFDTMVESWSPRAAQNVNVFLLYKEVLKNIDKFFQTIKMYANASKEDIRIQLMNTSHRSFSHQQVEKVATSILRKLHTVYANIDKKDISTHVYFMAKTVKEIFEEFDSFYFALSMLKPANLCYLKTKIKLLHRVFKGKIRRNKRFLPELQGKIDSVIRKCSLTPMNILNERFKKSKPLFELNLPESRLGRKTGGLKQVADSNKIIATAGKSSDILLLSERKQIDSIRPIMKREFHSKEHFQENYDASIIALKADVTEKLETLNNSALIIAKLPNNNDQLPNQHPNEIEAKVRVVTNQANYKTHCGQFRATRKRFRENDEKVSKQKNGIVLTSESQLSSKKRRKMTLSEHRAQRKHQTDSKKDREDKSSKKRKREEGPVDISSPRRTEYSSLNAEHAIGSSSKRAKENYNLKQPNASVSITLAPSDF